MKKYRLIATLAGSLLTTCVAYTYPTLAGPSGYAVLPNAAVTPAGEVNVAADIFNGPDYLGNPAETSYPIRVTYGVCERLEAGAAYNIANVTDRDANTWNVNLKYQFPGDAYGFTFAGGARYAHTEFDANAERARTTTVYLVATRAFDLGNAIPAIEGSVALAWTTQKDTVIGNHKTVRASMGAAANLTDRVNLSAEIQTKQVGLDEKPLYAVTARYRASSTVSTEIGITNLDTIGLAGMDGDRLFAGVNYAWRP